MFPPKGKELFFKDEKKAAWHVLLHMTAARGYERYS
jgi:hypothetical protein